MALKCWRHTKALIRKNFINWFRSPGCSTFEILAPILLMVALVVIRMQIPVTYTDQAGMFKKKYVSMPGVPNYEGTWQKSSDDDDWINDKVRPMFIYADYYERHHGDPAEYSISYDWHGPQFFAPSQCIKVLSWQKPRRSSPLIAIIGSQTNITDSII